MHAIRIANAPCSWGSLEFANIAGEEIPYEQMLDELSETGYTGTELGDWGYMPTDPAILSEELTRRHLTLVGAFVPVALRYTEQQALTAGEAAALRVARLLASVTRSGEERPPFLVLADNNGTEPMRTAYAGRITEALGLSNAQWHTFAANANHIAHMVREETGLPTAFHHHCAGYVETPMEIARLLELTDPSLLGLVFDTGHYLYGSGGVESDEIMQGLTRFRERIVYMHFKDCQPQLAEQARNQGWDYFTALQHGIFCELGKGRVPFPNVVQWLHEQQYSGWITVEQDILPGMGSPKASALRNRAYLRTINP